VITSDLQASVCLEVLPSAESGTFLCGPLLRYFRGSRLADSRWRLKEGLYMQLLQLQLAHPGCLDIAVLLHVRNCSAAANRSSSSSCPNTAFFCLCCANRNAFVPGACRCSCVRSTCGLTARCCTQKRLRSGRAPRRSRRS
jgi:hypothetical protein